jgi:hypothetical protein
MKGKNHMLELTSVDGAHFTAYAAQANRPDGIGIDILSEGRGLFPIYIEMADSFAAAGLDMRDEKFEFASHLRQPSPTNTASDVAAAIQFLLAHHTRSGLPTLASTDQPSKPVQSS